MKSKPRINKNRPNVAVLMGGIGDERQVSIQSGANVAKALEEAGVVVTVSDIHPDDMAILDKGEIDVFFLALHGKFGEDGQLQGILEKKKLVYTGSGPEASRLAFDKILAKKRFLAAGVLTPDFIEINSRTDFSVVKKQLSSFGGKYVVKPVTQGSSVGIGIFTEPIEAVKYAVGCLEKFGDCMLEKFVPGRELTVGIVNGAALPIIEIRPKAAFYDYNAKYVDDRTEYLFDTIDDAKLIRKINKLAIACFESLGCRHLSRVDFIFGDDGNVYALEVNTIPGFTSHSLLPKAAAKEGISMSELCLKIINAALDGKRRGS